jgi:Fibronectin type III domain
LIRQEKIKIDKYWQLCIIRALSPKKMATEHYSSSSGLLVVITRNIITLFICCISGTQIMADSVTLTWDPNSIPNLAGYRLYSGTTPGVFTQRIEVGNSTTISVSNLTEGQTYFFAVTAYNTSGAESPPSNISYTAPFAITTAAPVQASAVTTTAMAARATTPGPTPRTTRLLKHRHGMGAGWRVHGGSIEAAAYARWSDGH